jgi:hypothetical protein
MSADKEGRADRLPRLYQCAEEEFSMRWSWKEEFRRKKESLGIEPVGTQQWEDNVTGILSTCPNRDDTYAKMKYLSNHAASAKARCTARKWVQAQDEDYRAQGFDYSDDDSTRD